MLKDGASAIYGSTRSPASSTSSCARTSRALELTAEYGDTDRRAARNFKRATGTFGFGDLATDRFNVMVVGVLPEGRRAVRPRSQTSPAAPTTSTTANDTTSGNTFPANIVPADGSGGTRNPSAPECPGPFSFNDPLFTARPLPLRPVAAGRR